MLRKTFLSITLASLLVSSNAFANDALQRQLDAQQRTMLQMQNEMLAMRQEINSLKGKISEFTYQISRQDMATSAVPSIPTTAPVVQGNTTAVATSNAPQVVDATAPANTNTQTVIQNTTTQGSTQVATTQATATQSATPASSGLTGVDANAKAQYDAAYALVLDNKLAEAESAFKAYLQKYPQNSLTPNAWYWQGQVQYKMQKYDDSRVSFLNVVRFNDSQKRPDSLYKLGMISKIKGDTQKAMRYFELVVKTYPNDTVSSLARRELGM